MENSLKYFLVIYIIINFGLTFFLPTYRVWKKTGIVPITFGKEDNAHDYIGKIFKTFMAFIFVLSIINAFFQEKIMYLLPIWYLETPIVQILGYVLLCISLIWVSIAQYQMSDSWRIGIDEKNKTALVSSGIFSLSRNPIFLGMLLTLLGLFFVIPNIISFTIFVVSFVTIQIQVRLEEDFLRKIHGSIYKEYCNATRRWI